MIGDVNVLYLVPKDLAWKCVKRRVYRESVRMVVYKSCLDNYITRKTLWNIMPLVEDGGVVAVHCNYHTLSHLVEFSGKEGYHHDVVFFHGRHLDGLRQEAFCSSAIPFILIYKGEREKGEPAPNLLEVLSERPLEEIAWRLLNSETDVTDIVMFIGDAIAMAPVAKKMCRHVIAFGDEPSAVEELKVEGVSVWRINL